MFLAKQEKVSEMLRPAGLRVSRFPYLGLCTTQIFGQQLAARPISVSLHHCQQVVTHATSSQGQIVRKLKQEPPLLRQPVPALEKTIEKFLRSVRPLLSPDEFCITEKVATEFAADGGVGRKLQKLLEARAAQKENWLADWWLHVAYLGYRYPLLVHSSPGMQIPRQTFCSENEHLSYAARFVRGALDYKSLVDGNKLPQEMAGKLPLDMSQYHKVFGTHRSPAKPVDTLTFLDPKDPPRHIIVAHNNQFFSVEVLQPDGGMLTEQQIAAQLQTVVEESPRPGVAVGVLTTENRDTWADVYQKLCADPTNIKSLDIIRDALFVLCLDGPALDTGLASPLTVAGLHTLHGGGSRASGGNRWYDKTLQLVVACSGEVGGVYEHSPAEGGPVAALLDHAYSFATNNSPNGKEMPSCPSPVKLAFNLQPELEQAIQKAQDNLDNLVADVELCCYNFPSFGKDFIKSQKLSPDSFIQTALQLAFYRLHRQPAAHYESAGLRIFLHGRTEAIRSCSSESVAFACAMLDEDCTDAERVEALHAAIAAHKELASEAARGEGVDRHLLGLRLVAQENNIDVPAFYKDAGWTRSTHWRVSTSQVPFKSGGLLSFGPVVPDGYGCCYNPLPSSINFGLSAFRSDPETSAESLQNALRQSLLNMHDLLVKSNLTSKL